MGIRFNFIILSIILGLPNFAFTETCIDVCNAQENSLPERLSAFGNSHSECVRVCEERRAYSDLEPLESRGISSIESEAPELDLRVTTGEDTESDEKESLLKKIGNGLTPQGGNTNGFTPNVYGNIGCIEWQKDDITGWDNNGEAFASDERIKKVWAKDFNSCRRYGSLIQQTEAALSIREEMFNKSYETLTQEVQANVEIAQSDTTQAQDMNALAFEAKIALERKKISFYNEQLITYTSVAGTLGVVRLGTGWNTQGEGDQSYSPDMNSQMRSLVLSKVGEFGLKAYQARQNKKASETALAQMETSLAQWLAGAGDRANTQHCLQYPNEPECQGVDQAVYQPLDSPSAGSGLLGGSSIGNFADLGSDDTIGDDTGNETIDQSSGTESESAVSFFGNSGKYADSAAAQSTGGSVASGGASSGGASAPAGQEVASNKSNAISGNAKKLYKKKRKARRRGRALASAKSKKNAQDLLSQYLNKKKGSKTGGIIFNNRKEVNRALAQDGVRKGRSLTLFQRVSRAHQIVLQPVRKEMLVYNPSPF